MNNRKPLQNSIVLAGTLALVAVGSYYLFFQPSGAEETIAAQGPTVEIATSEARPAASLAEAHVEAQIPLLTSPAAHNHDACNHDAHAHDEKSTGPVAAPLVMTPEIRQGILGHAKGQPVSFALPGGVMASGVVELTTDINGRRIGVSGSLTAPQKGKFFFEKQTMPGLAGEFTGIVHFEEGEVAYNVVPGADGAPEIRETHVDNVICRDYSAMPAAEADGAEDDPQEIPADHPTGGPIPAYQNGVIPLSSLPTATAVAYLDFDGEQGPFPGWGNFDAAHSGASNTQIKEVWERVAEDYAPFNINITTDLQVYLDAPANSRIRCIVTPTNSASPGAGGVAFVGDFNRTADRPCWSFYTTGTAAVTVISHEIGHTLKLSHDGVGAAGYSSGHGSGTVGWGPIMGAPYSKNLSQWSKGEYFDSNQSQDDLFIITNNNNNMAYRTDDHDETYAGATYLEVQLDDSVSNQGVIETSTDFDSFRFTTESNGNVSFTVETVNLNPNLDILAEIVSSDGTTVIASANPGTQVNATVTQNNLAAGDYILRVSGVGYGTPLNNPPSGYTEYGSLGFYSVTGTVPNAVLPDRFLVVENSANTTAVGTVTPRNTHSDPLIFAIASGNSSGAFAIEPSTGVLTVDDSAQFDFETLSTRYDDPATFELFVDVTNTVNALLNETVRVVVEVTDVNEAPTISSGGTLSFLEHTPVGAVVTKVVGADVDRQDFVTYAITGGNTGNAFAIDASGEITFAADTEATVQSVYTLTVEGTDQGSPGLTASTTVTINLTDLLVAGITPSSVKQAYYHGITGGDVSDLVTAPNYPASPDAYIVRNEVGSPDYGDNYGSRIRGYIIPPTTGTYTFWLAMGDSGRFVLSTDENPANATIFHEIAANKWANYTEWDKYPEQESATVELQAGQPYYFELLHKEAGSGDWVSLGWQGPTLTQQLVTEHFIAPYEENFAPALVGESFDLDSSAANGAVVGTVNSSDINQADTVGSFSILSGNTSGAFAINSTSGEITVANSSALTSDAVFTLEIQASDDGSPVLYDTAIININVVNFLADTNFEAADGFTGYVSPDHALLSTTVDNKGATWSTPDDARIWNDSSLPPLGTQCLTLGINGTATNAELTFPGTTHGVRKVHFDYASFSSSTAVDFSLSYRVDGGAWVEAWTTSVSGLNPNFENTPWGFVTVDINQLGDVDLQFKVAGDGGVLIDTVQVTDYSLSSGTKAIDDTASVDEDSSVIISPLTNDTAADVSYTLNIQSLTSASNGSLVNNGDGTVTYTPTPGFYGTDSFGYIVNDGNGGNSFATVTMTVNSVYDNVAGGADALTVGAEDSAATVEVFSNDTADKGLTASIIGIKSETLSYDAGTSGDPQNPTTQGWTEAGSLTGSASANDNGSGLDAWIVDDPTTGSGNITYSVAPTAGETTEANNNGWMLETKMRYIDDYNDTVSPLIFYGNGSTRFLVFFDLDSNDDLTAQLVGTGGGTYTLTSGGTGADAFHDFVLGFNPTTQTASFYVDGTRYDAGSWSGEGSGFNGVQFGTDSSGGQGKAAFHSVKWSYFTQSATLPSGATATMVGDDTISFDPDGSYTFVGAGDTYQDNVYYVLTDETGGIGLGNLVVDIQGVDDLPAFASDPVVAPNGALFEPYTGTLADYGGDPDTNDTFTFGKVSGSAWLSIAADGTFSGSPTSADGGLNSFTVDVNDGKGNSVQTTLEITVTETANLLTENFQGYDVENPSDFSVGTVATGNWTNNNTGTNATRIFDTGNYGGTRLWISNVNGTELTSKGVTVGSNAHYSMSAVLLVETGGVAAVNVSYDILVGQTEAEAMSLIGGPQSVTARGDDYLVTSSKTDHVFTHNFQTSTVNAGDKLFVRYTRISGSGWFGVDDVSLDLVGGSSLLSATFPVAENSPSGTSVTTVTSSDGSAAFSITAGNSGGQFAIDAGTGAITTTSTVLDYEVANSYPLTIVAALTNGQMDATTITVDVTNVITGDDGDADALNDDWEMTHYGNSSTVTATDDTDGDGYTAFEEMVFGMNPTVNDSGSAPQEIGIVDDGGTDKLQFKFLRPQNWATLNVSYQLQTGDDLVELNWADNAASGTITTDGTNEWISFLFPLPTSVESKTFYRCKVTVNP